MTKKEFMDIMVDLLDCDNLELEMETELKDLEDWDSLSYVDFQAIINMKSGKKLVPKLVHKAKTIGDLYDMVK